jgi:rhodanese-related sulfurtransferase
MAAARGWRMMRKDRHPESVMKRIVSLLGLGALLWLAGAAAAEPPPVPAIGGAELEARLAARDPALVVLDVRTPAEFAAGHVPGALNIPHDQVEARLGELAPLRDRDIVVYCGAGKRAALALAVLGRSGYPRLHHLEGDMQGWVGAGRPVEKPRAAPPATP